MKKVIFLFVMIVSVIFLGLFVFGADPVNPIVCQNDIDCVKPYNELSCGSSSQCPDRIVNNVKRLGICNNNHCTWACVTDDDCPKLLASDDYTIVCVSGSNDNNLNNKCYLRYKNFNCYEALCTQTSEIPVPTIPGDYNNDDKVNCADVNSVKLSIVSNSFMLDSSDSEINAFLWNLLDNYDSSVTCS